MDEWKQGEYPKRMLESIKETKVKRRAEQQKEIEAAKPKVRCEHCGSDSHSSQEHARELRKLRKASTSREAAGRAAWESRQFPAGLGDGGGQPFIATPLASFDISSLPVYVPPLTHRARRQAKKRFKKLPQGLAPQAKHNKRRKEGVV